MSWSSWPVYGLFHHEPIAWRQQINLEDHLARRRDYYAAQGNATRLFFRKELPGWPPGWEVFHAEAFSCFYYLLSGGYAKRAQYLARWLAAFHRLDAKLSRWPRVLKGGAWLGCTRRSARVCPPPATKGQRRLADPIWHALIQGGEDGLRSASVGHFAPDGCSGGRPATKEAT